MPRCLLHFKNLKVYLMSILILILIDLYLTTIRGVARNYRNGVQMRQDCVSTNGETIYGCTSASLCSSKNHVSLADLVMVGPGKLMVVHMS